MIAEAVLYATARSTPDMRRLGLVGDAVALWSRATRCRRAWAPHEARCRRFVEGAIDRLASRRTALVLGSGLCRDVPVERLVQAFEHVILVDAVHLLPARYLAWRLGWEPVLRDLTGFDGSKRTMVNRRSPLSDYASDPTIDLVISANVLSQLALAPARAEQAGDGAAADPEALSRRIAAAHIADLYEFDASVCLMTDVGYTDIGPDGQAFEMTELVSSVLLPSPWDEAWDWTVAPRGEISRRFSRVHHVRAWHNPNRSRRS